MSSRLATVAGFLEEGLEAGAERRLIEVGRDGTRRIRTVAELAREAERIARRLRLAPPGEVLIACTRATEAVPAAWACLQAGRTAVIWPTADPAVAARLRDPVLLKAPGVAATPASWRHVLSMDGPSPAEGEPTTRERPGEGSFLIATSGTTGVPKLVEVPHRVWWTRAVRRGMLEQQSRRLVSAPLSAMAGMQVLLVPLREIVFLAPERLAAVPEEIPALVSEFGIASLGLPSSLAARVADVLAANPGRYELSSLKRLSFGGERIVPSVVERLSALARDAGAEQVMISYGYGTTETGLLCASPAHDPHSPEALADPVSVGPPVAGWSIRVVDHQIQARSEDQLFAGYRDDPAAAAARFTADGWYRTGDRGYLRDGELIITGREQAIVIINGRNVSLDAIQATAQAATERPVIATAHRPPGAATDELLLFVVTGPREPFDELCRVLRAAVGAEHHVLARHLVRIEPDEIPRTHTGKVLREELAQGYASGRWAPHLVAAAPRTADEEEGSWLGRLWQDVLGLTAPPGRHDSFYALGGDSLAAAEIIHAVELHHRRELDVRAFFAKPTIATLRELLQDVPGTASAESRVVHQLETFLLGWQGARSVPGGLLVTRNEGAPGPPLCWVFQSEAECDALAGVLDRPLHAMRSCVGLVDRYTTPVIDAVCRRYLPELLELPGPILLGGNCQGAILALGLARALQRHGRPPALLLLMEWSFFHHGGYTGPTRLLYGAQSHTARHYVEGAEEWRAYFPAASLAAVPGAHGQFFQPGNVEELAAAL